MKHHETDPSDPEYRAELAREAKELRSLRNQLGITARPAQDAAYREWEDRVEGDHTY